MPANIRKSTLTKLKLRVFLIDHIQNAATTDDFAIWSALFQRSFNFHIVVRLLFVSKCDSTLGKIIWRHFDPNFIAWKDFDVMHTHLSRDMGSNLMTILKYYAKHCVGQSLNNCSILLDCSLFCHLLQFKGLDKSVSKHILDIIKSRKDFCMIIKDGQAVLIMR